jgi:hypothetical protein
MGLEEHPVLPKRQPHVAGWMWQIPQAVNLKSKRGSGGSGYRNLIMVICM